MFLTEDHLKEVVHYLSNHFELFFSVAIAANVLFLLGVIAFRLRETPPRVAFASLLRRLLMSGVVVGLCSMYVMLGYIFWYNYHHPAPIVQFPGDIEPHTHWVRDNLRIYFIDENKFLTVRVNGRDKEELFHADDSIRDYHVSPDGGHILVSTLKELHLIDVGTGQSALIASLEDGDFPAEMKGAISGIRWAPDGQKFCYDVTRWSPYSSQDKLYVYSLPEKKKLIIQTPTRRISSLYWDKDSQSLYYLRHEAQDTSLRSYPFDVRVFRIPLATLQPEFVTEIPHDQSALPIENLNIRGIDLFLGGDALSFNPSLPKESLVSDKGQSLGIDAEGYLYFVPNNWFRKRLFKVSREPDISQMPRYQYKGGDFVIGQIRWLPGSRYAIMHHRYLGVLVLEPATRNVGLLVEVNGHTLGWYEDVRQE